MTTPRKGAPDLAVGQGSKEVTHNEANRYLEQGADYYVIVDRDLTAPPGACDDGAAYIVAAAATEEWDDEDGHIAVAVGEDASNGWLFITPIEGTRAYVQDENAELIFNGAAWAVYGGGLPYTALKAGKHTVPIMAAAMTPRTTSGAAAGTAETTTHKVMLRTLDFDQATDEFAQFMVPMPKSWNLGTVTARFIWTCGVTGDVVWGIQGRALSDDDVLDAAFGAAVTVTDAVTATGDVMQSAESGAVTIAGAPAAEDLVVFQVYRDADNGSDNAAGDALLVGVRLYITLNAADDA